MSRIGRKPIPVPDGVTVKVEPRMPPLKTDRQKVKQIVLNLLDIDYLLKHDLVLIGSPACPALARA